MKDPLLVSRACSTHNSESDSDRDKSDDDDDDINTIQSPLSPLSDAFINTLSLDIEEDLSNPAGGSSSNYLSDSHAQYEYDVYKCQDDHESLFQETCFDYSPLSV